MPATELILSPATLPDDAIEVARIADAWGVKGWFKVIALSNDPQALLKAKVWFIQPPEKGARHFSGVAQLEMRQSRFHGDGMVGWAQGVDDRDQAEKLKGARVFISRADFPKTGDDEFYWVDLMGLTVINREGLELGVVSDLSDFDGVALHPCWRDQLALLAPAGHPLAHAARVRFAQALEHPMVGLKPGSTLHSRLLRAAAELGRSLPMQVQVGSFDAMCAMIAAGMGVGIMPRAASLPYLDALRLTATPLDESWAEHQLYLCRRTDSPLPPAAARLFAHLADTARLQP